MNNDDPGRTHSARVQVVAVVAAAAALFLLIDGVLTGAWVRVLWVVLGLSSGWDWWTSGRRGAMDRRLPRLMSAGRVVWCLGLGAAGVLAAVNADSVLICIGGWVLVVAAVCGGVAIVYEYRSCAVGHGSEAPQVR